MSPVALAARHDAELRALVAEGLEALAAGREQRSGPLPAGGPDHVARHVAAVVGEVLPDEGTGEHEALSALARVLAHGTADPSDPACAAHLHCPTLAVAAAADLVVAALNPSLDSWDQAPAGTVLEHRVVATLAELVGYDPTVAAGVITSGGTESNLTGLLLARDAAVRRATGQDAGAAGLPPGQPLRLYASKVAHFSVQRAAAVLGLGERAVVPVPVDRRHRMDPAALDAALRRDRDGLPAAVVATAGTTDLGAIDPLPAVAQVADAHRTWLHVDAAYGGGALLSDRLAGLLDGISLADSVALDLHKLGWQPVAAGALVTRDALAFRPLARQVAYLNPPDDEAAGYSSLLGRSLRTTRRADVFKLAVTFRALGRAGLGALVDACHDLARHAARTITARPDLELAADPVLTTVVFRYRAAGDVDGVNARLRRRLLADGTAVIGRTEVDGAVHCKLTLLNPRATAADVDRLLAAVVAAGRLEEADAGLAVGPAA